MDGGVDDMPSFWMEESEELLYVPMKMKRKSRTKKMEFVGWGSKPLIEFLESIGKDSSKPRSQYEVTSIINEYVNTNNLIHPQKKKRVQCDERLHYLFGKKSLVRIKIYDLLEAHFADNQDESDGEFFYSSEENDENMMTVREQQKASVTDRKNLHPRKKVIETPKSCFAATILANIKLVYLKRSLVQDLLKDPETFEGKLVGSFVRVKCDPNDLFQKNSHQLLQVTGVRKASGADNSCTNILLQVSDMMKEICISMLSDDNFSEEECEDLRQRVKSGSLKRPTVVEFQQKAQILHEDITKHWLVRELNLLQNLIDRANEKGWRKEYPSIISKGLGSDFEVVGDVFSATAQEVLKRVTGMNCWNKFDGSIGILELLMELAHLIKVYSVQLDNGAVEFMPSTTWHILPSFEWSEDEVEEEARLQEGTNASPKSIFWEAIEISSHDLETNQILSTQNCDSADAAASGSADVVTASTVTLCDSPKAREENRYFSSGGVSNRQQEGKMLGFETLFWAKNTVLRSPNLAIKQTVICCFELNVPTMNCPGIATQVIRSPNNTDVILTRGNVGMSGGDERRKDKVGARAIGVPTIRLRSVRQNVAKKPIAASDDGLLAVGVDGAEEEGICGIFVSWFGDLDWARFLNQLECHGLIEMERHVHVQVLTLELCVGGSFDADDLPAQFFEQQKITHRKLEESKKAGRMVDKQIVATQVIEVLDDDSEEDEDHPGCGDLSLNDQHPGRMIWHYKDPRGIVQGPFSVESLKCWRDANYFPPEFKVWKIGQRQDEAVLLTDVLLRMFSNSVE
ncbi:hypothetical protein RHSIM_Rhsim09G0000400 [Rhododendron simsii]|uniref:Uncharacterized protein n=1 Tax=Rhododendron simsii TaxID=118357 RepID=A0A834LG14_RHOSS|nr:hypothetical protein RHSIM_Rhsim09G0000400 [Rhododendron simsii]